MKLRMLTTVMVGLLFCPVNGQVTCDGTDSNAGCLAGCLNCEDVAPGCEADQGVAKVQSAQNFFPVDLALVQAGDKFNRFQEGCRDAFLEKGVPAGKIQDVATIQAAITAIEAEHTLQGGNTPINVVICGHGSPGSIKVGEDLLEKGTNLEKFTTALNGKINRLILFGCSVGKDVVGLSLVKQLEGGLGMDVGSVKAWDGTVYAYPNDDTKGWPAERLGKLWHEGDKVAIPTVSEWGLIVLALIVFTVGTVALGRRRQPATA